MKPGDIKEILVKLQKGSISVEEAISLLSHYGFDDIGFAKLDYDRDLRQGVPEVVFAGGKRPEQVVKIAEKLYERKGRVLITRARKEHYGDIKEVFPANSRFFEEAGVIVVGSFLPKRFSNRYVLVVSAGTSDIPVAEEAALSLEFMGLNAERLYDVGVAGIHRLFAHADILRNASVCIVVAGMEGALASVVGGLVSSPVIAVPTSIGYGANFNGLSSLLAMLNSCVPGIGIVNIDNGFGAAMLAYRIISM